MKRLLIITVYATLLCAVSISAQERTSGLRGIVTKFYGDRVSGTQVKIKLKSGRKRFSSKTAANVSGEYFFNKIPPGVYEISASDNGMTYQNTGVEVLPNQTMSLDIRIEYGGDCAQSSLKNFPLSEPEKSHIVNEILSDVLLKRGIAMGKFLNNQKIGVILANENIQPLQIKPLKRINLKTLSKLEIHDLADKQNLEFLYLSFGNFKTKGNCLIVSISNVWAVPYNTKNPPTSGGGNVYIYNRKAGKLRLKAVNRWTF